MAIWVICLAASPTFAQTITRVQTLSFGTFALRNNNAPHALRVSRTNVVTADSEFAIFTDPTRGEYSLSSFPTNTPFTVFIPDTTLTSGGGAQFDLGQFTPGSGLTTDGTGNADLRFGATLTTSGTGGNYTDGSYSGTIDITVNY